MGILNLFSKRQKKLRGEIPDVYQYDSIPPKLRTQICFIIRDTIGVSQAYGSDQPNEIYTTIHDSLAREYGVFSLHDDYRTPIEKVLNFFLFTKENEKAIDVIEVVFKYINGPIRNHGREYSFYNQVKLSPDQAINELNDRFKEHGVGYQFDGGEIIKVDSAYSHSEIVKPTLSLLFHRKFKGANDEFLKAHEHYRHGRNKECLSDCLKAFESTLKIICKERGWVFNDNDTSKKLIQICFQNDLVPPFIQNQFTSLQNLFESGVPTIRNKLGGHGQGQIPKTVDDEITRYALNLTGTNIIFLVEQSGIS